MASVPSAGCLLARNQFYRTRHNSTSSTSSSSSSCCDLLAEHERTPAPHGIHIPFEKCWWLKNFLHCENPQPAHPELSSNSGSS